MKSKKHIKIVSKLNVFNLLIQMLLNIQLLWVNKVNYNIILIKLFYIL